MKLALPPVPDRASALRRFALGPLLSDWSEAFQPEILVNADKAMSLVSSQLSAVIEQQSQLEARRGGLLFSDDEDKAEEMRLVILAEKLTATLDRLAGMHAKTVAVSAAALLHAMTRGSITEERQERDASPRRRMASGADQVVEV